ncbi:roquin-1 [Daphnia magna]|uniref:roquin-1 n=1 Tax=Daphnia magna TaxID=35525 RepID=UPI001E1BCF8B|nr:roquin-1 [Daphnia magna]XP_045024969.1 roquin-1 [Daphnia magna]
MPIQAPQWTEFLSCPICRHEFDRVQRQPISLACGHTLCKTCLAKLHRRQCPFDQSSVSIEAEDLPVNTALLQLISPSSVHHNNCAHHEDNHEEDQPMEEELQSTTTLLSSLNKDEWQLYRSSRRCVEELALFLKISGGVPLLSRPMQRKLVTLITCQLAESEGRARAVRAARSLGERTVTELILQHQNPQQLSANLWAAVRARGCQFLGPAMQEEVLRLVLLALEDGSALSRKVLVMFVVQRLEPHFPQASKTSIGHVVQLLYRASCFKVSKREGDSSLMQLKDEFRTYDSLRREHDAQIVQIATEAGLRIAPDQWSSLLYGDSAHKSHMQSIIDKLQTPQSFGQSVQELVIALQRTGDPHNLSNLRPSLELLAALDPCPDATLPSWSECDGALEAARMTVRGLIDFVSSHGGATRSNGRQSEQSAHGSHGIKYKTSLCRDLLRGGCPRGANCTFAHSEEELDRYRSRHRKNSGKLRNGTGEGGSIGSQENLVVGVDAAGIAMITETDPTNFYFNPAPADGTPVLSRRPNYGAPPYTAAHVPFRSRGQYGASAYPTPPPTYGAGPHLYGAPSLPPQPEYGTQAPMADYPTRPIETARLIPSLASQSLGVLQSRKQEILDQLEKIGTTNISCQNYSIWNGRAAAAAATQGATGYNRAEGLFDDDFIPFGAPICSKYGPISRLSRIIPRASNPIQAASSFGHSLTSTPMKRTPLISTGRDLGDDWNEGQDEEDGDGQESKGDSAPPAVEPVPDFLAESERMKYELELIKQQIDELKMATREASIGCMTEGRQRLSRELHMIEENIREKERQLRLTQRKRRSVATPVHGKAPIDWDVKFFNGFSDPLAITTGDDEDTGIANGMRELELRLQHELEEQE